MWVLAGPSSRTALGWSLQLNTERCMKVSHDSLFLPEWKIQQRVREPSRWRLPGSDIHHLVSYVTTFAECQFSQPNPHAQCRWRPPENVSIRRWESLGATWEAHLYKQQLFVLCLIFFFYYLSSMLVVVLLNLLIHWLLTLPH